jgi:putative DNA primase/helicase
MGTHIHQFSAAMAAHGITPPDVIEDDGELRRFSTNGKPFNKDGWYVLHGDGVAAGAYGCWRMGLTNTWCKKSSTDMTPAERDAHHERVRTMRAHRDAMQAQRQHDARQEADALFAQARRAMATHPVLKRKGIQAHGVYEIDEKIVIPLRDTTGVLHSYQTIFPNGDKRFQPGGRITGCYYSIGQLDSAVVVCEGFSTGASIHECTAHAVAVAFSAGNVMAVALALRSKYPQLKIILAADDDYLTDGNPGLAKATAGARAVKGLLAVPAFSAGRLDKATDFNDLHQLEGAQAVRQCFESATEPVSSDAQDLDNAADADAWLEPMPLPDSLPSVAPLDMELLPYGLRAWVADIAMRMQCPVDFTAVGAVVALSSLIGARAVVKPKAHDDWAVVPNLWGVIVGRPGVLKSPALNEVLKPLHELEKVEREQWGESRAAWEHDCKVAGLIDMAKERDAKKIATKNPEEVSALLQPTDIPTEPTMRRYVVNDASVEKLGDLMVTNEWGVLVYRDEIHSLLCSMDKQGQEGARGFYLTGYDGNQSYAVDRIGRGESFIPRVCLAMLGGIQPGKLESYVREAVAGGAGDDGLLQRFGLMVWPDVDPKYTYIDRAPDMLARKAAWDVFDRLNQLQPASNDKAVEWHFSPEAQLLFEEWLVPFENEIRSDKLHPALVSHLSKYRKLIPALALIFALVDTPESGGVIHENELIRALAWGDYLRGHAERVYTAAVMPETAGAATLLAKIRTGKLIDADGVLLDSFTPRQVAVKHWAGLTAVDPVRQAADLLVDYGWLRKEGANVTGRRNSDRYLVHPELLAGSLR